MPDYFKELREDIRLLAAAISDLNKNQNQMIPKMDYCMRELEGINTEGRFIRTLLGGLQKEAEFYARDLKNIGTKLDDQGSKLTELVVVDGKQANDLSNLGDKIKDLELKQLLQTGIMPNEPGKWMQVVNFIANLPTYLKPLKPLLPWIISGLSIAGAAVWEFVR